MTVRGNPGYCQHAVSNILKLIDQNFWDEYIEDISGCRILDLFEKWRLETEFFKCQKMKLNNTANGKKRIKNFRMPHLVCDMENVLFYVVFTATGNTSEYGEF